MSNCDEFDTSPPDFDPESFKPYKVWHVMPPREEMIDVVIEDRAQALRMADLLRRLVDKPPALIEHLLFEVAVWEVLERAKPGLAAACALDENVALARVLGEALRDAVELRDGGNTGC
jgi:hypothetical protein